MMQYQQNSNFKKRLNATFMHLAVSFCILICTAYIVFFIWYPAPLHTATGVTKIYLITVLATLLTGPTLTFIVYKSNKIKLLFNYVIITLLQSSIFFYGMYAIAQGRPAWLVFVVDDFELISPSDIIERDFEKKYSTYTSNFFLKPQWISAQYSKNPKIQQQQKEDEMFSGINMAARLEAFNPIEQARNAILARSKKLAALRSFNTEKEISSTLNKWSKAVAWLPLKTPKQDMVILINSEGEPLTVVDLKPWN